MVPRFPKCTASAPVVIDDDAQQRERALFAEIAALHT
jgi:hypothetical protein